MSRGMAFSVGLFVLYVILIGARGEAAPIPTLFSTGVSPSGAPLPDFAPDPHYALTASPGGFYPVGPAITVATADLPPAWAPNTATSKWVNPTGLGADMADWHAGGVYVYTTTFSLAGFVPSTTTIALGWAADDNAIGAAIPPYDYIAVNGFPVASTGTGTAPGSYEGLHLEILGPGLPWLPGINTLDFVIANTDLDPGPGFTGPTGLHVHILSAEADLIPEPSSFVLCGFGLAGTVALVWRRQRRG